MSTSNKSLTMKAFNDITATRNDVNNVMRDNVDHINNYDDAFYYDQLDIAHDRLELFQYDVDNETGTITSTLLPVDKIADNVSYAKSRMEHFDGYQREKFDGENYPGSAQIDAYINNESGVYNDIVEEIEYGERALTPEQISEIEGSQDAYVNREFSSKRFDIHEKAAKVNVARMTGPEYGRKETRLTKRSVNNLMYSREALLDYAEINASVMSDRDKQQLNLASELLDPHVYNVSDNGRVTSRLLSANEMVDRINSAHSLLNDHYHVKPGLGERGYTNTHIITSLTGNELSTARIDLGRVWDKMTPREAGDMERSRDRELAAQEDTHPDRARILSRAGYTPTTPTNPFEHKNSFADTMSQSPQLSEHGLVSHTVEAHTEPSPATQSVDKSQDYGPEL